MVTIGSGVNTFSIDFVAIENVGNADDRTGNPGLAGSVAYEYQIGKHEGLRAAGLLSTASLATA